MKLSILGAFFLILNCDVHAVSLKKRVKIEKKSRVVNLSNAEPSEDFNTERAALLQKKRQSLIQDIKAILKESKNEAQKTELNLRLGSLYMEEYRVELGKAQKVLEDEMTSYKNNPKAYKKMPELNTADATASMDKARSIYKDLYARYPQHSRRDEVLYFLGMSSIDRGNAQEGVNYFNELAKNHPKSKYFADAMVQSADYYFDNNQFREALEKYNKLISGGESSLKIYATYKKAWCEYNLQNTEAALNHFKYVIEKEETELTGAPIRVRNEAIRDIALPFVELKRAEEAIRFYSSLGDKAYRSGLESMASLFLEKGDYKNSSTLYSKLIELDNNHAKNAEYEAKIVEGLRMQDMKKEAITRLFERLPNYAKGSSWYEINSNDPTVVKEGLNQFEEIARKYALEFHAEAQKTKNEALYDTSKDLYAKYLEFFPSMSQAPQIRFYLAEILYRKKLYLEAANHYTLVYKDKGAPGPLKKEAITDAIRALDEQMNAERKEQGLSAISSNSKDKLKDADDKVQEQTAYSTTENSFFELGTEYVTQYPKEANTADVLYMMSYINYIHFDFSKAYKGFWQVLQQYPEHSNSYASAYLVLDILNRKKDFTKLSLACQKFLATKSFSKPEFKKEVADILRKSELKRIAAIENQGDFKTAAKQYVEYTKTYGPQDESLFEKALYNASVDYAKAGLFNEALEVQEQFLRKFQKSELRRDMLLSVAKTHETLAHFDKSAEYFALFATQYPSNDQAENALRLAGLYYWGSGDQKKAEATMLRYAELYPKNSGAIEKDLMELYDSQNASEAKVKFYLSRRAKKGIPISLYVSDTIKIAEIAGQKSTKSASEFMAEAEKVAFQNQKELMNSPRGVECLAKILFWNANQKEAYFSRISLQTKDRQLEINLQKKLALLKELEKDYAKVASLQGGEWGLGSIFKTANAYHRMATEVLEAPVPTDLPAAEVEEYRKGINNQIVTPFKEKSLGLVSQCMDKTQEFNVISHWTARCYNLGTILDKKRFPSVRTFYLPPTQVSLSVPDEKTSLTKVGNYKSYVYPFNSTAIFRPTSPERMLASSKPLPSLYDRNLNDSDRSMPVPLTYRVLAEEREQLLIKGLKAEAPKESASPTFQYLNLARQTAPEKAVTLIKEAISKDPTNQSLHNLLGLAYLDAGNIPAAKVVWLSMSANNVNASFIWNNLGVASVYEGHEETAMEYFQEATKQDPSKEAYTNLGFLALKYRNGFEAKQNFTKAIALEKDNVTTTVGLGVAKLQGRDFDGAKDALIEATRKFKTDPYGKLSLIYLLSDGLGQASLAKQLLGEYVEKRTLASDDLLFQNAARDLSSVASNRAEETTSVEETEEAAPQKRTVNGEIPEGDIE